MAVLARRPVLALAALMSAGLPAAAATIESAYTRFDADKCRHKPGTEVEDYGSWSCPGYGGLKVRLSAGDQRMTVTFGRTADDDDLAASQSFPAFNSVYQGTVEWRLARGADGRARPFATILRWNVRLAGDEPGPRGRITSTGRVLVVTRLGPGGTCHVGYVDARANPDANALARAIADEAARSFACGKDKPIVRGVVGAGLSLPKGE